MRNKLKELKQELEDVKTYVKYYEEKDNKKELERWKIIEKYVFDKYARELAIQNSMNS